MAGTLTEAPTHPERHLVLIPELTELYGSQAAEYITAELNLGAHTCTASSPEFKPGSACYVAYPQSVNGREPANFFTLARHVPRIAETGFRAIHVLPFLKSPRDDEGFDIAHYQEVDLQFGGEDGFREFLETCHTHDITVFMDLVFNHTSDQHPWFQQAIAGSNYHQNLYLHTSHQPRIASSESGVPLRWTDETGTEWVTYSMQDERGPYQFTARLFFAEQAGPLPHFVEHNQTWYFHNFYPSQPDLDWNNPNTFLELARVVVYWAQRGLSFRLDAIPFMGKNLRENKIESHPNVHRILRALRSIAKTVNPNTQILVEALQEPEEMRAYFGSDTQPEADLAYHFPLTLAQWAALAEQDTRYLPRVFSHLYKKPEAAQWVSFLRNHDQLSGEIDVLSIWPHLRARLQENGLPFMGELGLAGRLASLLNSDEELIALAFLLQLSLPGTPFIFSGDEYGMKNDLEYMSMLQRALLALGRVVAPDTRNINRSPITENIREQGEHIRAQLAQILSVRNQYLELAACTPQFMESAPGLLHMLYELNDRIITILINFSDELLLTELADESEPILRTNGAQRSIDRVILPARSGMWLEQGR